MTETQSAAEFVEVDAPESPTTGHSPSMFTSVEVRIPMDRWQDGRAAAEPVNSEEFCKFAAILGPERFGVVLNHFRPQIEEVLNAQVLAIGFVDAVNSMGFDVDARDLAEDFYDRFLEVVTKAAPAGEYEKYEQAVKGLGFDGIEALEKVVGTLSDRARKAVLEGV